jgi:hypothetical protein
MEKLAGVLDQHPQRVERARSQVHVNVIACEPGSLGVQDERTEGVFHVATGNDVPPRSKSYSHLDERIGHVNGVRSSRKWRCGSVVRTRGWTGR